MEPSIKEISSKLQEYKENKEKVLNAIEKNNIKIQDEESKVTKDKELRKLLNDIEKAIGIQQDLLSVATSQIQNFYSGIKLKSEDIGKKCNLYYEKDAKWYPGEISSVNINAQTAEVTFFGFSERHLLPASFIQVLLPPKRSELSEGLDVEVLLEDGKWHYAYIEEVNDDSVLVKLARWGHRQSVSLDAVKIVTQEKRPLIEKDVFVIPDKIKIQPNDPENVRLKKKKKIKALRSAWRASKTEKETKFYTSTWKSFQKTGAVKKDSMFRCPQGTEGKIGLVASGRLLTRDHSKTNVQDLIEDSD